MSRSIKLLLALALIGAAFSPPGTAHAVSATLTRVNPNPAVLPTLPATTSPTGNVTASATFIDVQIPPPPTSNTTTSGCESTDFAGFPPGNIAVMQRGFCTFDVKTANAQAAGASAVVIFNEGQPERTDAFSFSLSGFAATIPVVSTSYAAGAETASLQPGVVLQVTVSGSSVNCASPPAPGTPVPGMNVIKMEPGVPATGTSGPDVIYGTNRPDRISALGGDDVIYGYGGADVIYAGVGNDTVCGGGDDDTIRAGGGNDIVEGNNGDDVITGDEGDDDLAGNGGANRVVGGDGTDACDPGPAPSAAHECETV